MSNFKTLSILGLFVATLSPLNAAETAQTTTNLQVLCGHARGLDKLVTEVEVSASKHEQPIVVIDVDDTLVDVRYRKLQIYNDFVDQPQIKEMYPVERYAVKTMQIHDVTYEPGTEFPGLGITDKEFTKAAVDFWKKVFLTNSYLKYEQAIGGASQFVRELVQSGATVIYLTGRNEPDMGKGTVQELVGLGFPLGKSAHLMMKPNAKMDDLKFKKGAFDNIEKLGTVVGVIENEPRNINAMVDRFPTARPIFLKTLHSNKPDVPYERATQIPNFFSCSPAR